MNAYHDICNDLDAESGKQIQPIAAIKLAIALALAALADWLFYGERVGLSLVIFAIAIASGSALANHAMLNQRRAVLGGIVVIAGLVPAIEELNAVSFVIMILSLALSLLLTTNPDTTEFGERARALRDFLLIGPFRIFRDAMRIVQISKLTSFTRGLVVWIIPAVLSAVFIALFATANPLIERGIALLDPTRIIEQISLPRILFWTLMVALVWPFIHVQWRRRRRAATAAAAESSEQETPLPPPLPAMPMSPSAPPPPALPITSEPPIHRHDLESALKLLDAPTVLRSLILFNLLFAAQSILDAIYLWGNVALPASVTYATYAHRGAYPLIVTALLAAAFVLVAMRPGGPAEKSKIIRRLVYLWVGQNVLLVASSILRLDLYVEIYLLTYWRIAAFVWMGLVALGLVLIVARIAFNRSNQWLVRTNLIALTAVFYVVSLVNFDAIIADYNVAHSYEFSGKGVRIDTDYLLQLGPQALPAIEKAVRRRPDETRLVSRRNELVEQQRRDMSSWRTWGFRTWRLQRKLDAQAEHQAAG